MGNICEICGKETDKKLHADGKVVCYKHYNQFKKYGEFKDNTSRTFYDPNEILIYGDTAYVSLYDRYGVQCAYVTIDTEDIPKIENIKWHLNGNGYAINTSGPNAIHMHRLILGVDEPVDHINGDKLDNRKRNLRPITKSQNLMNSNSKGYYTRPNSGYQAYIKLDQVASNLGVYNIEEEAMYARWYAERITFGPYAYNKPEPQIPEERKVQIRAHVDICLNKLFNKIGRTPDYT